VIPAQRELLVLAKSANSEYRRGNVLGLPSFGGIAFA